jgi:hypothetical protein
MNKLPAEAFHGGLQADVEAATHSPFQGLLVFLIH